MENIKTQTIYKCDCEFTGGCEKCNPRPSFIGMLSDGEADRMREEWRDWKKRFDDSLNERHLKLFPYD